MVETAKTPEESLWRAVILRYSSDIFKLKVDMDEQHLLMQNSAGDINKEKWLYFKKTYEKYAFKMQKFRNELEPVVTNGSEVLPLREICEHANVSFDVFKIRILDIIDGVSDLPNTGKQFRFRN